MAWTKLTVNARFPSSCVLEKSVCPSHTCMHAYNPYAPKLVILINYTFSSGKIKLQLIQVLLFFLQYAIFVGL